MKEDLTPSRVFSSLVVFERLQNHVRFVFVNLNRYYAGLISIGRIEEFLGGVGDLNFLWIYSLNSSGRLDGTH